MFLDFIKNLAKVLAEQYELDEAQVLSTLKKEFSLKDKIVDTFMQDIMSGLE